MEKENIVWGPIRAILMEFTFYNIKDIVGLAGFDLTTISEYEQRPRVALQRDN